MSTELIKNFSINKKFKDKHIENKLETMFGNKGLKVYNHLQTGVPAISLSSSTSNITSIGNDIGFDYSFSQQFSALSKPNDVLICFSTSGNSNNVINAAMLAKAKSNPVISFTSNTDNELSNISDIAIQVESDNVQTIQEQHLKIYHLICEVIEKELFKEEKYEQLN
ncbi:D-sedoheptulose-7-phosphate isomerase [Staphylococcus saprophyticus]